MRRHRSKSIKSLLHHLLDKFCFFILGNFFFEIVDLKYSLLKKSSIWHKTRFVFLEIKLLLVVENIITVITLSRFLRLLSLITFWKWSQSQDNTRFTDITGTANAIQLANVKPVAGPKRFSRTFIMVQIYLFYVFIYEI